MLWDEFPLMLYNLRLREGDDAPIQLLDHLRTVRIARADRLRFLFTSSVGLRHVLRSLREADSTNDPVSDMLSLTVPPMDRRDTCKVAEALLRETCGTPAHIPRLASEIATQIGGFPFYVRHVVAQLARLIRQPNLKEVSAAVDQLVYDPYDTADFDYDLSRLASYDLKDKPLLAMVVLDTLARQPSPTPAPQLLNLCRLGYRSFMDEQFLRVLTILTDDYFIRRTKCETGLANDFRWPVATRRWIGPGP